MGKKKKQLEQEMMSAESEAFLQAINRSVVSGKVEKFDLTEDRTTFDNDDAFEKMVVSKLEKKKKEVSGESKTPSFYTREDKVKEEVKEAIKEAVKDTTKEITFDAKKEDKKEEVVAVTSDGIDRSINIRMIEDAASYALEISDGVNTFTVNGTLLRTDVKGGKIGCDDLGIQTLLETIQKFYPSAVFKNDDFVERTSGIKEFNPDLFINYQAGEYILSYYVSAESSNAFTSFVDRADRDGKIARAMQDLAWNDIADAAFVENEEILNYFMDKKFQDQYINAFRNHEETVIEDGGMYATELLIPYGYSDEPVDTERYERAVEQEEVEDDDNTVLPSEYRMNHEDSDDDEDDGSDLFGDEDEDDEEPEAEEEEENVEYTETTLPPNDAGEIKHPKKQTDDMVVKVEK